MTGRIRRLNQSKREDTTPHQQKVHGVQPAELLADAVVICLQQRCHQSGHVKARVPQRQLQNTNSCEYCTFLHWGRTEQTGHFYIQADVLTLKPHFTLSSAP